MPDIKLESFEALVLVEFLLRFRDKDKLKIDHDAEEQILYDLCAILESEVPELIDQNYKSLLDDARAQLLLGEHY